MYPSRTPLCTYPFRFLVDTSMPYFTYYMPLLAPMLLLPLAPQAPLTSLTPVGPSTHMCTDLARVSRCRSFLDLRPQLLFFPFRRSCVDLQPHTLKHLAVAIELLLHIFRMFFPAAGSTHHHRPRSAALQKKDAAVSVRNEAFPRPYTSGRDFVPIHPPDAYHVPHGTLSTCFLYPYD